MQFNSRILNFAAYPMTALAAKKRALQDAGKKVYDFGTGDPIEPTADFIKEAVGNGVHKISQYPTVRGSLALRESIRDYVKRRFSVTLDTETEMLPATGSKEAIYNLAFLLVEPGTTKNLIIASDPGYFVCERSAAVAGAEYLPFPLTSASNFMLELSTLKPEVLERTAIAWLNYPHNPTGVECDLDYYRRQVEICKQYGILLCSDECYCDIYFSDVPPPSVLQVTKEGVLAFHSCSKRSGMTAYRSGFMAGDKQVIKHYASFRDTLGVAQPVYTQAAATAAWADDAHVAERIKVFRAKRDLFIPFFQRKGIDWVKSEAGLYFWVKAPGGDGSTYAQKLLEAGIVVTPGEMFSTNSKEYFRIAIVPSVADCAEAIGIWEKL